MTGLMKLFPHH